MAKKLENRAKKFEFEFRGLEINKIGKSRSEEAKLFEFKKLGVNKKGKSRCGQAKNT